MQTTNEQHDSTATPKVDAILDLLRTQGQIWARYGLTLGRVALETNARALHDLAGSLGKLADALAKDEPAGAAKPGKEEAVEAAHDELRRDEPAAS